MALRQVSTPLKRDRVASALREAIARGELRPGERLVEARLARELGVSQTPVREALAVLAREGFVVQSDHRGAIVSGMDREELDELITLRAVLEGYAARRVAERGDDRGLDVLAEPLAAIRAGAAKGDVAAVADADSRFHEALVDASGHRLLAETTRALRVRLRLAMTYADAVHESDLQELVRMHEAFWSRLEHADPDEAEQAAREHVLSTLTLREAAQAERAR